MADEPRRIIDLTETQLVGSGDYLALDSADGGTKKVKASYFSGSSENYMWGGIQGDINDQTDLMDALGEKANIDGYYEDLTSGSSEQLLSNVMEEDKVPYNFRTSGGSVDIGDRVYEELVGLTLPWNQLVQNGNFADTSGWTKSSGIDTFTVQDNVATLTFKTSTQYNKHIYRAFNVIKDHKYFFAANINSSVISTRKIMLGSVYTIITSTSDQLYAIFSAPADSSENLVIGFGNSDAAGSGAIKNVISFDLTHILGSTIADYIYSIEQSVAGSGVAFFKALFPKDYYAHDAGSLQSMNVSKKIARGFNQWDGQWEIGDISSSTGEPTTSDTIWRTKNFIRILPNTTYHAYSPTSANKTLRARFYDANKNYIGYSVPSGSTYTDSNFTTPSNAYFMKFAPNISYIPNHDVCINLHWDGERDGEYESYEEREYSFGNVTMRGILKIDGNNKLYANGDRWKSDGTLTRSWVQLDNQTGDIGDTITLTDLVSDGDILCSAGLIAEIGIISETTLTLTKAISGASFVYEVATPTTESADSFTSPQWVDDWGTEEFVDRLEAAGTRDVAVPAGHDSSYTANLKGKIEMAPDSPSSNGDYVMRHNNGQNAYVLKENELPSLPAEDGTYVLKCTVADGTASLSWVAE